MKIFILAIIASWLLAGGCIVAGIVLLVGTAWALIATGVFLIVTTVIMRTGLMPNG